MTVATTILEQLGGNKFIVMTGAKNLLADKNSLSMRLPRNMSKANNLKITLNGMDLYDMEFTNFNAGGFNIKTGKTRPMRNDIIEKVEDIYCDQLQDIFTSVTGMYTHL